MAIRTAKTAMAFALIVATVLIGVPFSTSDDAFAGAGSSVIVVRPGFDDRFEVRRPFFNPFIFDDDVFFDEEDFFFDREDFFFERDERPFFFGRFEREDERERD